MVPLVGGLLPLASVMNNGLMNINGYRGSNSFISYGLKSNDFFKLFSFTQYAVCVFNIVLGNTSSMHQYIASVYVNNRCQGSFNLERKLLNGSLKGLYAKRNDNNELTLYIKVPTVDFPTCAFSFQILPEVWNMSVYGQIDNSVTESDLILVM